MVPDGTGAPTPALPTVPSRELHILIEGIRLWCGTFHGGVFPRPLMVLCGDAGAGKSLILGALKGTLDSLGGRTISCVCPGERFALEPVRILLRQLVGGGGPGQGGFPPFLRDLEGPLAPEVRRLLPDLALSDGGPERLPLLTPALERLRSTDALARTFIEASRTKPLVLLVDDLHRIDPLSRDVLAAVVRMAHLRATRPMPPRILVIASVRRNGREGLEEILDPRFLALDVDVRGYSREDLNDLIRSRAIIRSPSQREALLRATGGNPLQVQFHLDAIAAGGPEPSLPEDGARAQEAFRQAVLARFASMPARAQRIFRVLAALGRPFPEGFVAEVLAALDGFGGQPSVPAGDDFGATLERLLKDGWARWTAAGSGAPALGIADGLIASILLDALPAAQRSQLHQAVGETLLARRSGSPDLFPREFLSCPWSLAFHHIEQAPAHPRWIEAGLEAAREADGLGAVTLAIEIREKLFAAMDPAASESLWLEVGERLAEDLESAGIHHEAIEVLHRLASSAPRSRQRQEQARTLQRMGSLYGRLGEFKLQIQCYHDGLDALRDLPESLERLKIYAHLARVSIEKGETAECTRFIQESMKIEGQGDLSTNPEYLEIYSLAEEVRFHLGDYVEALSFEERIFEHCAVQGDHQGMLRSAGHLAHLHFLQGSPDKAIQCLEAGLERTVPSGSRFLRARLLEHLGRLYRSLGRAQRAQENLAAAKDLYRELGCEEAALGLQRILVHLHLALFEIEASAAAFEDYAARAPVRFAAKAPVRVFPPECAGREDRRARIQACRRRLQDKALERDPQLKARLLGDLAVLLVDAGDLAEAGRLYDEAIRIPELARTPTALARILQDSGRLRVLQGDQAKALSLYEKSLECMGPAPEKFLVGGAYLEVGSIFQVQGEGVKAYEFILRGLRIFIDLESDQGLAVGVLRLAVLLREAGVRRSAARLAAAVADFCRGTPLGRWEAEAQRIRGALASEAGDFTESDRSFRKASAIFEAQGLRLEGLELQVEVGWEAYRRENYPLALGIAREGIEAARSLGAQDLLEDFLFLLGAVESALSNRSKNFLRALEILKQALTGAQERGRPSVEAQVLLAIALIYEERGKAELGREYRDKAKAIAARLADRLPPAVRLEAQRERKVVVLEPSLVE